MKLIQLSSPRASHRLRRGFAAFALLGPNHSWLIEFLEHRIGDRRILRLIRKWLHAGVIEEGEWSKTTEGSPKGSVISPLLSNVYLHYVFDLWIEWWRKKHCRRDVVVVRYADDCAPGKVHLR